MSTQKSLEKLKAKYKDLSKRVLYLEKLAENHDHPKSSVPLDIATERLKTEADKPLSYFLHKFEEYAESKDCHEELDMSEIYQAINMLDGLEPALQMINNLYYPFECCYEVPMLIEQKMAELGAIVLDSEVTEQMVIYYRGEVITTPISDSNGVLYHSLDQFKTDYPDLASHIECILNPPKKSAFKTPKPEEDGSEPDYGNIPMSFMVVLNLPKSFMKVQEDLIEHHIDYNATFEEDAQEYTLYLPFAMGGTEDMLKDLLSDTKEAKKLIWSPTTIY